MLDSCTCCISTPFISTETIAPGVKPAREILASMNTANVRQQNAGLTSLVTYIALKNSIESLRRTTMKATLSIYQSLVEPRASFSPELSINKATSM